MVTSTAFVRLHLWALPEPVEVHFPISPFKPFSSLLEREQPLSAVTCLLHLTSSSSMGAVPGEGKGGKGKGRNVEVGGDTS